LHDAACQTVRKNAPGRSPAVALRTRVGGDPCRAGVADPACAPDARAAADRRFMAAPPETQSKGAWISRALRYSRAGGGLPKHGWLSAGVSLRSAALRVIGGCRWLC
jgi:hypothetical protein